MKVYRHGDTHYFCGRWNGSPIEVALTRETFDDVPDGEVYHVHPFREYIVLLEGSGAFLVNGERVEVEAPATVMFEPGDAHRFVGCRGARWVLIKERSEPGSKTVVVEPEA